jgi:hypothetical protein
LLTASVGAPLGAGEAATTACLPSDQSRTSFARQPTPGFELSLDAAWIIGMVLYAVAAIECEDPTYASPLFERLEPWDDRGV